MPSTRVQRLDVSVHAPNPSHSETNTNSKQELPNVWNIEGQGSDHGKRRALVSPETLRDLPNDP